MKRIFITGISTDVGKTIAASIVVEALKADYWKPVQAGDLDFGDAKKVDSLISNSTSVIHPCSYELRTPMSPHAAADLDGIKIDIDQIKEPVTSNHLVVEGAGGLLVPLNRQDTILDLIQPDYKVILVSRHYLGSINHTLLSLLALEQRGLEVSILFSGDEHPSTEQIILQKTNFPMFGRIGEEDSFDQERIRHYANQFREKLELL
ncbi:MAG: dethiobiotin synthase [Flavobacteriaceae bacterium]